MRNPMKNKSISHLNAEAKPLSEPGEMPSVKYINVRGRREHEAIIKDGEWCKELGLDQVYETIVYLNRWGGWLTEN